MKTHTRAAAKHVLLSGGTVDVDTFSASVLSFYLSTLKQLTFELDYNVVNANWSYVSVSLCVNS